MEEMKRIRVDICQLKKIMQKNKCVCFGSGAQGIRLIQFMENWDCLDNILYFTDNNPLKWGSIIQYENNEFHIKSIQDAFNGLSQNTVIVVCSLDFVSIFEQLDRIDTINNNLCLSLPEVSAEQLLHSDYDYVIKDNNVDTIPKIIHYCWFGGEMPDIFKKNIDNWHKICPDYEIKRWDESNYDISKNKYMEMAYLQKRWGFVPDYARLDILYKYGGIYIDTDVEIVGNLDELLYQNGFTSFSGTLLADIGSGTGAIPGNNTIKELRDYYDNVMFSNKHVCQSPLSALFHSHNVLKKHGLQVNDTMQKVGNINIYPMIFQGACAYLNRKRITEKTFFVHYGAYSWMSEIHRQAREKSSIYEDNRTGI